MYFKFLGWTAPLMMDETAVLASGHQIDFFGSRTSYTQDDPVAFKVLVHSSLRAHCDLSLQETHMLLFTLAVALIV